MNEESILLRKTMGSLYTYIIIFGIYIIYNGHLTPGGGFQGGAILASVFIIHYLVTYSKTLRSATLNNLEKFIYVAIVVFAIVLIFYLNPYASLLTKRVYLIIMNGLIGIKVSCGLTVVFYRFIFFESR
jgi:multicomponent Na+:H+ antiporter subunit B